MDLEKLCDPMNFKWRVQSFSKYETTAMCIAYIDSRSVQAKLDDVCGMGNWQDLYYEVGSMLFCKIGIKVENEWIWKSDTGSASKIEKEKGHSSDAFKRAAVKWGVGRFLYEMKPVKVKTNEAKTQSNYPYIIDDKGKKVWDLTAHITNKNPKMVFKKDEESFLSRMAEFARFNSDIYWAVMNDFNVKRAQDISDKGVQVNILKQIEKEIKKAA